MFFLLWYQGRGGSIMPRAGARGRDKPQKRERKPPHQGRGKPLKRERKLAHQGRGKPLKRERKLAHQGRGKPCPYIY